MDNTEKVHILKSMRALIEKKYRWGLCDAYGMAVRNSPGAVEQELNEIGLIKPYSTYGNGFWYDPADKESRYKVIDEAIEKWESEIKSGTILTKDQIQSKIQSIEDNITQQTIELAKLKLEMDKPEKPTLEKMNGGKAMHIIHHDGSINTSGVLQYRQDAYLSRERAEKEKLRIKLSVIADYLNGGLFEPKDSERGHFIYFDRKTDRVMISWDKSVSYGKIYFRTIQYAELATTYFTNDELIKMLR